MKLKLAFLLSFVLCLLAKAQLGPLPSLSGGNVNITSSISNTFLVSGQAQVPALNFANSNNIPLASPARDWLIGFTAEAMDGGWFSNIVAMPVFANFLNPTNSSSTGLAYIGGTWTYTGYPLNLNDFGWNAYGGTNQFEMLLSSPVTSNTIVVVWRDARNVEMSNNSLAHNYRTLVASLDNHTNGASVTFGQDYSGLPIAMDISPLSVRAWGGLGGIGVGVGGQGTNAVGRRIAVTGQGSAVWPRWSRAVDVLTSDTSGNHTFYSDAIKLKFNTEQNPQYTYTSYVLAATNPLTYLRLCRDTNYTGFTVTGLCNTNFFGEYSLVIVLNKVASSNEVNSIYRAVRWLDPSDTEDFYQGDSKMNVTAGNNMTNNLTQAIQRGYDNNCWHDYAVSAATLATANSMTLLGGVFPLNPVAFLPAGKVKKIRMGTNLGGNDAYNAATTAPTVFSVYTNFYAPYYVAAQSIGASFELTTLLMWNLWPEAALSAYNASGFTNFPWFNNLILSNGFGTRTVNIGQYVTRDILATLFVDATHPLTNTWFNENVARVYHGGQWFAPKANVNPVIAGDFSQYNTNWNSGRRYTNDTVRTMRVSSQEVIVPAAVAGFAGGGIGVSYDKGVTFTVYTNGFQSLITTLAMPDFRDLVQDIPPDGVFFFTNLSTGVGNSATFINGKATVFQR